MGETIKLEVQLRAFIRRDTRTRWIAVCPHLDVVTQGTSAAEAKRELDEAVHAWFDDCIERDGFASRTLRVPGDLSLCASAKRKQSSGRKSPAVKRSRFT